MSRLDILAPCLLDSLIQGYASTDPAAVRVARTLARATFEPCIYAGFEAAVLALFDCCEPPSLAGVTAAYDLDLAHAPHDVVRADPVYLRADPTRVILFDADSVGLDAIEADGLLAHLNAALAGDALEFKRGRSPLRWYATGLDVSSQALASPRALRGQAIESCLDELRKSGPLNRLVTEAQMVLYEAPVNVARESSGRAPLNSIWFWGAGPAPVLAASSLDVIIGDDDLVAACARHAGITHHRDASTLEAALAAGATVAVVEADASAGHNLAAFEHKLLLPALANLRRQRLNVLRILTRSGRFVLTGAARWRLWRRVAPFIAVTQQRLETNGVAL